MIVFLLVLAVVFYYVERYSLDHAFDRVSFKTELDKGLVEPGECFLWTMTIENKKKMMVPYLRLKEQVPAGLTEPETGRLVEEQGNPRLSTVLYLSGGQRVVLKRTAMLTGRGRYFVRGASAEAGDFLGFKSVMESYPELAEVVVKPKAAPIPELSELPGGFPGEFSSRRGQFEDPVLIRGFREYTGREPFRSISWTQSARHMRLLVKEFEQAADLSCTVLLNTECLGPERTGRESAGGPVQDGERLELCFSMVRSVCEKLEKQRIPYDFRTNGVIAGAMGNWSRVEEGLGAGHLETVLEGLGRMTYGRREDAETFYNGEIRRLRAGRSVILVTPELDSVTKRAVFGLEERSGRSVVVLEAGKFGQEGGVRG